MPDLYVRVTEAAPEILEALANALEMRAADPQQRAMLQAYLRTRRCRTGPRSWRWAAARER